LSNCCTLGNGQSSTLNNDETDQFEGYNSTATQESLAIESYGGINNEIVQKVTPKISDDASTIKAKANSKSKLIILAHDVRIHIFLSKYLSSFSYSYYYSLSDLCSNIITNIF